VSQSTPCTSTPLPSATALDGEEYGVLDIVREGQGEAVPLEVARRA
jgi:hypothetical protein